MNKEELTPEDLELLASLREGNELEYDLNLIISEIPPRPGP